MDFELELVPVPASDVDRAKAFNADYDHKVSDELRFVQLTPPGSALALAQPPRDVPESHADPLIPFRTRAQPPAPPALLPAVLESACPEGPSAAAAYDPR